MGEIAGTAEVRTCGISPEKQRKAGRFGQQAAAWLRAERMNCD